MENQNTPLDILHKYYKSAPVDVHGIAKDLGINVLYAQLGDNISGAIKKDEMFGGSSGYLILVNQAHHPNRQRFTIAHELAHYILHKDFIGDGVKDDALYRGGLSNVFEKQADKLAADILMPRRLVKELIDKSQNVEIAAQQLQVSKQALEIFLGK